MELWLDTIDLDIIKNAQETGILTGVTTNPSILSTADTPPETKLKQLLDSQPGFVAAQVIANDFAGMVTQAKRLALLDEKRIIIKIPVTADGLRAMAILSREDITTMATAIFESSQVFLSAKAGAKYAAPYLSKIEDITGRSFDVLKEMLQIISQQQYSLKILAASINSVDQVVNCAKLGVQAITLPAMVYQSLLSTYAFTEKSLISFSRDWSMGKCTNKSEVFN